MNQIELKNRDPQSRPHVLRSEGIVPGILYGPQIDSQTVEMPKLQLKRKLESKGEVYELKMSGKSILVKFEEIQTEPVTGDNIHFSLVQMPRGVRNDVEVPLEILGENQDSNEGAHVVTYKEMVTIHGVPSKIPHKITVDISEMKIGDTLSVADLNIPKEMEIKDSLEETVAVCQAPTINSDDEPDLEVSEPEILEQQAADEK